MTAGMQLPETRIDPIKLEPESPHLPAVLELVRQSFAFMEARINPPSSIHKLTIESLKESAASGEIWVLGAPPHACIFLKKKVDHLYIGKLAVSDHKRGQGCARQLVELAAERGRAAGLKALELETRVQLVENHQTFARLGFETVGTGTHEGFSAPTYIIMRRTL